MEINRKQILETFLRIISHISDIEYQERVWILGKGPEGDGFDETVCVLFSLGNPMLKEYKKFGISEDQYRLLIKFRDMFESFSDEHDLPQAFINTPEWESVVMMAKEVLKAFNYTRHV